MATRSEKEELFKTIWAIADDLRGAVDGWNFKAYVLGSIFYRYISENLTSYINKLQHDDDDLEFDYSKMSDEDAEAGREQIVEEKGFFIKPSQLFCNVVAKADEDKDLNQHLFNIFREIEASSIGSASEEKVRGLFADFVVDSSQLGGSVADRNERLAKVLTKVACMPLSNDIKDNKNDIFGDAYEYLMKMYAANAGKSGGEFFTPQEVSEVLARIAAHNNPNISSVYDPACGSGSLLLKFSKIVEDKNKVLKYYGQEINPTTYNLCRINMFLHNINYNYFDIQLGDTLLDPKHRGFEFDAIVSNPPYSLKWVGNDNALLINDDRFSPAGILAPKNNADLAFAMHMVKHLKDTGTCAIVEFPGVLYRSGAEKKIREFLINKNYIDTVIQLPANLFFGVGIATCIIVMRKERKPDSKVLFIDATKLCGKDGNKNYLRGHRKEKESNDMDAIVDAYKKRTNEQHFSILVKRDDIVKNDYNLSVSSYVEPEDTREIINITAINNRINELIPDIVLFRDKVDDIIKEIECKDVNDETKITD